MAEAATSILSVRITPGERELLESAAEQTRTSLSDFVRRRAVEAAEMEMMERRLITIPAADWEKFEAWMNEPAREIPAMKRLAAHRPVWAK